MNLREMMGLINLSQIGQWLHLPIQRNQKVRSFQNNSQQIQKDDLFFAYKGERADGHAYLMDAASRGACAAIVSKQYAGKNYGMQLFYVDDVLVALHQLAKQVFNPYLQGMHTIGVTGSVGKTTTKEFLAELLTGQFSVIKTPGNFNSQWGLPLSVLNQIDQADIFVMEMGMSSANEIKKLVDLAPPKIALITQVGLAHATFFPDGIEGIARAKAEIFSHPYTQYGVAHAQAMSLDSIRCQGTCQKITYGWKKEFPDAHFGLEKEGIHYRVIELNERSPWFELPFSASHLCENFVGASVVCRLMGMSWDQILEQIHHLKPYKHRFEAVELQGITFINDAYNANPLSMKSALKNLPLPKAGGKTIAVLGSMRELGAFCEMAHQEIAQVAEGVIDHLICIGEECRPIIDYFQEKKLSVEWFDSLVNAKISVFSIAKEGDVVLIKGSNSHQLWKILE